MKNTKRFFALRVVAIAGGAGLLAVRALATADSRGDERRGAATVSASRGPIRDIIISKGTVAYDHQLALRAPASGRLVSLGISEGQTIRRGQSLLRVIDPQDDTEIALRNIERQRADIKLAALKDELGALARLVEVGSVARYDLDQKKLEAEIAVKERDRADVELRRLATKRQLATLMSPLDGMIVAMPVVAGQMVNANEELLSVAGGKARYVVAYLDAMEVARIAVGQSAVFSDQEDGGKRFPGKVIEIARAIASSQRQNTVRILVEPLEPLRELRLSQQLYVEFVVKEDQDALRIPRELVYTRGDQKLVNVLTPAGARAQLVEIGRGDTTFDIVVSGITASDRLLPKGALGGMAR